MRFTYLTLITFFLIINCFFNLFLLKNNYRFNRLYIFNILICLFILLAFDTYNVFYKKLLIILIYITFLSYNLFKFNKHLLIVFNILKLWIFNSSIQITSFLNLIILLELVNWIVIILILILKKKNLFFKIIVTFITLNIISLTLWTLLYLILIYYFKTTNLTIITFCLYYDSSYKILNCLIFVICLTKLGAFIGPKFQVNIYNDVISNVKTSFIYLYYNYIILPLLIIPILSLLKVNFIFIIFSVILIILTNIFFFNNFFINTKLVFLSSQISLIYLILFLF